MERYVGLDAHVASCTLAVISGTGKRLQDFPIETNGAALVAAIRAIPGRKHLIFEEGAQSAWLYETLHHHVDELVVAGIVRNTGSKSDASDAYGLAEKLRINSVDKRIFKAPQQFAVLRELARVHTMLVRDVVRVQVRLKAIYQSRGIPTPGTALYGPQRRGEWESQLPMALRCATSKLYAQYDALLDLKTQAESELIAESKRHAVARILRSVPGLGPIRVARLLPIVVTPHRFRTKRQFWSYCGFGLQMRSSSDWMRDAAGRWQRVPMAKTRGLSLQHNHVLKDVFKGAATTVIQGDKTTPLYGEYARLLAAGCKPNLAKLTLARKIAAITLRIWKDEEVYRPKQPTTAQRPARPMS